MTEKTFNMREAVGQTMLRLAEVDNTFLTVSADVMGSCRMNGFVEKYPKRFFNVGIAEQEMVSFSAGLAREGFVTFAFTFGPFMSMRACEQIRTDVAYNRLNVRFISTYSGVSGGVSGATHWSIEDCAIMRGIPQITIFEPCDCAQLSKMLEVSLSYNGPIYFRITVEPVTKIYDDNYNFTPGKATFLREGNDGAFICSGITVKYALEASDKIFEKTRKKIAVVDMATIKPIDEEAVLLSGKTGNVIVAQDHNVMGGLGDAVASVLVKNKMLLNFKVLGIPDKFFPIGHAPWLYHKLGYDSEGLYNEMMGFLNDNYSISRKEDKN